MNTSTPKLINILITPLQTSIGNEIIKPDNIAIVLENGHAYQIDDVIDILEKHDKKKPSKLRVKRRIKRFTAAFKSALAESAENDTEFQPRWTDTPPSTEK